MIEKKEEMVVLLLLFAIVLCCLCVFGRYSKDISVISNDFM